MRVRWIAWVAGAAVLAGAAPAAVRRDPVRVAAFFWHQSPNDEAALAGFREGLATARLPWTVTLHRAGADVARARTEFAAIRRARPALVLALGTRSALWAREQAGGLPVVFTAVTNPVETGVVKSWSGSGTRLAGNSNWLPAADLLRTFLQALPNLRTLGVIRDASNAVSRAELLEATRAMRARYPQVRIKVEDVLGPERVRVAAERLRDAGADAVWVPIDNLVYRNLGPAGQVLDAAGIPIVTSAASAARSVAVVGVVPDYRVLGLKAAELARRVVTEGADPGRLRVGRLRTFRTVVNLKAAARCRYRVPLAVLAVADEVIR